MKLNEVIIIVRRLYREYIKKHINRLILAIIVISVSLIGYFSFGEYKNKQKIRMSDDFNSIIIDYSENNKEQTAQDLITLINKKV